jgi:hypothetical protein
MDDDLTNSIIEVLFLNVKKAKPVLKKKFKMVKALLEEMSLAKRKEFVKMASGQSEVQLEIYGTIPTSIFESEFVNQDGTPYIATISNETKERLLLEQMINGLNNLKENFGLEPTDCINLYVRPDDIVLTNILIGNMEKIKELVNINSFCFWALEDVLVGDSVWLLTIDDLVTKVKMIKV